MRALLAIDTADRTAGVALAVDGEVVAEPVERSAARPSERLFALVDGVLAGAGASRTDLCAVAVTRGPGSFTGLRVGLATAKGLAYGLGLPSIGVSTLRALARRSSPFPGLVMPLLDARKKQVYAGVWDGLEGSEVLREAVWNPRELARAVAEHGRPCLALGSGLGPYREVFSEALGAELLCAPETRWWIPPGEVARLGWEAFAAGESAAPHALLPVYLRRSEAEEARAARASR